MRIHALIAGLLGRGSTSSSRANFELAHQTYLVLDTETTGFDPHHDRILSIGLLRMQEGRILLHGSTEILIDHPGELGNSPTIHGLTLDQLENGVSERAALKAFLATITPQDILVAHYATFDRDMIFQALERHHLPLPKNTWLDTMDVQTALEPQREGNAELLKLDTLLLHYDIEATRRHSALGDAYATARVLQQQLSQCAQAGIQHSGQLRKPRTGLL